MNSLPKQNRSNSACTGVVMDLPLISLRKSRGKIVSARLKNGIEYRGRLDQSDDYMNLLLIDVVETTTDGSRRLGKAFIRGNNLLFIKIG